MAVEKAIIDEIKAKVSILDVISPYVELTKNGRNYLGLCPFHSEKTPSFSVNSEKGFYHCFGCGKSGDIFRFLEDYKNIDFTSALEETSKMAGVALDFSPTEKKRENPNAVYYEVNNQASRIYQTILETTELGNLAQAYLESRGITKEVAREFEVGLSIDAPNFLYQTLSVKFDQELLANAGLFNYGEKQIFDTFQNRLMFPITNQYAQTIGFSGRIWQKGDGRPGKYVNTAATAIFDKSNEFYNLSRAKSTMAKQHEVYLMEGFMDVIAAYKAGVINALATMGTALTQRHVERLRKRVKRVILVYDGDKAGQAAIQKSISLLSGFDVRIVKIPGELDPDEYAQKYGNEALSNLMKEGQISRSQFLMDYLRPHSMGTVEVQEEFLRKLAPVIAEEESLTAQDIYINRLVELLPDFKYNVVEEIVDGYRRGQQTPPSDLQAKRSQPKERTEEKKSFQPIISPFVKLSPAESIEHQLLYRLITEEGLIEKLSQNQNLHFIHEDANQLYEALIVHEMAEGRVDTTLFSEELSESLRNLFYNILEMNLPDEMSSEELSDLLNALSREKLIRKREELISQQAKAERTGNSGESVRIFAALIELNRQLEQRGVHD